MFGEEIIVILNEICVQYVNYKSGVLNVLVFVKGFGSKIFVFFFNFENMDFDLFDLKFEQQGFKLVKYLYIVSDEDGIELVVVVKDSLMNILCQIVLFYVNMFQGKMVNV